MNSVRKKLGGNCISSSNPSCHVTVALTTLSKNGRFILMAEEDGNVDRLYLYDLVTLEETMLLRVPEVNSIIKSVVGEVCLSKAKINYFEDQ